MILFLYNKLLNNKKLILILILKLLNVKIDLLLIYLNLCINNSMNNNYRENISIYDQLKLNFIELIILNNF